MKQVTKQQIANLKDAKIANPKVDYSMSTCYYRITEGDEVIAASVDPMIAIGHVTKDRKMWMVEL